MFNLITRALIAAKTGRDLERGAGFAEYAFLLALVALAALAALGQFGISIQDSFADTTSRFP